MSVSTELGDTEDHAPIASHIKVMKEELQKKQPNADVLKDRFTKSFAYRRRGILAGMSTKQVLKNYPCLQISDWASFIVKVIKKDIFSLLIAL